ncbi:MAG: hypothetical protein ACR2FU_23545 [Streptosporangiaceae bacterium]
MMGLSASIRVGLPSPGDPEGATGSGSWWLTGSCRPAYMWDRADRPPRQRRLVRFVRASLGRGHLAGAFRAGRGPGAGPAGDGQTDVSGAGN